MPKLQFYRESAHLLDVPLRSRLVIGRSDTCDLVVPGESVSRIHCVVTPREGEWILQDRSRYGTTVDGGAVDGELSLWDGARIGLEEFSLVFVREDTSPQFGDTTRRGSDEPPHQIVSADGGPSVLQPVLAVIEGPDAGRRFPLTRALTVGGPGSGLELADPTLRRDHLRIRIPRGRVLLAPGNGPTFLEGARVRDLLPLYPGEQVRLGETVLALESQLDAPLQPLDRLGEMVAASPIMRELFGYLQRIGGCDYPALLVGESGTGKELAARAIHGAGPRAGGPFVAVNCAAIPEKLFESELFGSEKGAFTGATARRSGAFHAADGGTIFLDEIGELPMGLQSKLLRVLESGEVRRVGGFQVEYPDARVIAATNRNLEIEIAGNRFRRDLYFRLAVLAVRLPPLRERPEDVLVIARAICEQLGPGVELTPGALDKLLGYDFPGNARELRNVLLRARVLGGHRIDADVILFSPWAADEAPEIALPGDVLENQERALLIEVMRRHRGNRSAAARELGVARSTLHYKLRKLGVTDEKWK